MVVEGAGAPLSAGRFEPATASVAAAFVDCAALFVAAAVVVGSVAAAASVAAGVVSLFPKVGMRFISIGSGCCLKYGWLSALSAVILFAGSKVSSRDSRSKPASLSRGNSWERLL